VKKTIKIQEQKKLQNGYTTEAKIEALLQKKLKP
jgi:hypothetical protein